MSYDGLTMSAVCGELQNKLNGARLEKIYQPGKLELHLFFRTRDGPLLLVCSADARFARIHLSGEKSVYPSAPPPFCMLLRKHLGGARLLAVSQLSLDRILVLTFRSYDEAGNPTKKRLYCEVMGKHSNLVLVSEDDTRNLSILGSAKTVTREMSRYRAVAPGEPYFPPPHQEKLSLAGISEEALAETLAAQPENKAEQLLVDSVMGLGPEVSRELLFRTAGDARAHPLEVTRGLTIELRRIARMIEDGSFEPCIVVSPDGGLQAFAPIPLSRYPEGWLIPFAGMNEALDTYFKLALRRQEEKKIRQQLSQATDVAYARAVKKKKLQEKDLAEAEGAEEYRLCGELLTAGLHNVNPGSKTAEIVNYYSDTQEIISIPLNPAFSPQENARRYFKKYRKLKDSSVQLTRRLKETQLEEQYLASLQLAISHADLESLYQIRGEMEQSGLVRANVRRAQEPEPSSRPLHFVSPDGISIFAGRNNRQNEILTLKTAEPEDIWLHAKDIPGAHIIIKSSDPPDGTLLMAARLAALYSKAASSAKVPVDYTQVRHVHKPKGFKPGMVIYTHQRTVYVAPAEPENRQT